ncbi:unnamed protein product [Urochloa decumbens]|uniref:Uncharacterized protein n=1 Tax=Urochloa decumbens TaxID=240449 RepID=A0ABC9DJT4_9POAL
MTKQSSAVAAVGVPVAEEAAAGGRGVAVEATTEEQARAIISMAKKAVEEAAAKAKIRGDGTAATAGEPSSLKRSLECFLEGRKNKAAASAATSRRRSLDSSHAASASSSN